MTKSSYDVLIIGAGAAGLACALELDKTPLRYLMLEARSRIGGRVFTSLPDAGLAPVELGAEFIHGPAKTTLSWMHKLQLPFYDVSDEHLFLQSQNLSEIPDYFEHLDELMPKKSSFQKRDPSVGSYLDQKKASSKWKKMFGAFVEGFHGADLNQIGVQGLLTTQQADETSLNGSQMFRHVQGYDQLIHGMGRYLRQSDSILLNTPVRRIEWSKGLVKVFAYSTLTRKEEVFTARKLVMTVPIEVLRSEMSPGSKIEWNPWPRNLLTALSGLEMGHVQRLTFRFRNRFWENLNSEKPVSFLHAGPEHFFPTWWSSMPLRNNDLVAWQGGPVAQAMSSWKQDKKIQVAFETLSQLSGRSISFLETNCLSCHTHDWSADPFSLGAYSYIRKEGLGLARQIFKPAQDTIYFAGEGTCFDSTRGTVEGAFNSGFRVGKVVVRSLLQGKNDTSPFKSSSHSSALSL